MTQAKIGLITLSYSRNRQISARVWVFVDRRVVIKSLFGNSWMSVSSGEIGAHGDKDHGL